MAPPRSNPTETEKRLDRIEAAISALAYLETRFANIPEGFCAELDAIRQERPRGSAFETRPHHAPEQPEKVSA